jgi:hypothetical protein
VLQQLNARLLTEFGGKVSLVLNITEVIKAEKVFAGNRGFKMKL